MLTQRIRLKLKLPFLIPYVLAIDDAREGVYSLLVLIETGAMVTEDPRPPTEKEVLRLGNLLQVPQLQGNYIVNVYQPMCKSYTTTYFC